MQLTEQDLIPPQEFDDLLAASGIERVEDYSDEAVAERVAAYASVSRDEDERGAQDDVEGLGAGGVPRTRKQAVELAREWIRVLLFVGVGYCLRTMRMLFNADPLYLDAETAYEEAKYKHPADDTPDGLAKIPWGVLIWWTNGRHGHVALYIGRGWCITTDYARAGFLCIARVEKLASWCGGTFRGWTEDVNGVHYWEPKEKPQPWDIDDRIREVSNLLERARKNEAKKHRIEQIKKWLDRMVARRDQIKENRK